MDRNILSPYVRFAISRSVAKAPVILENRCIFDYELILVSEGKCKICFEETAHVCKKGDVVWIPPGIMHRFEGFDGCDFGQPHIHFDAVYDEYSTKRFTSFKPYSSMCAEEKKFIQKDVFQNSGIPYVFTPLEPELFQKVFYSIITLYEDRPYGWELSAKAKMLELLNRILLQFSPEKTAVFSNQILSVKSYLENNFCQNITLDRLSDMFYINKFTLMRNFKRLYQENIMYHYYNLRISYAEEKLRNTSLSVKEIGEMLNFTDAYSFSRFFKQHTGMSPRAYREKQK